MVAFPVTAMEVAALGVSVKAPPMEEPVPIEVISLQAELAVRTGYLAKPVGIIMLSTPVTGTAFVDQLPGVDQFVLTEPFQVLLVPPA